MRYWAVALLLYTIAAPSAFAQKMNKQAQKYLSMTPSDFEKCATIKDDSLDTIAVLSTLPCFQERQGLMRVTWNDNSFRAFIDKKTGKTTFQVYQYIDYSGEWRFYDRVNYETPDGPKSDELTEIGRDLGGCSRYGSCLLRETIAFNVPASLLRTIASKYQPQTTIIWRFKYYSKSGLEWQDGIAPAEAAGIIRAADSYRARHGLPIEAGD